MKRKYISLILFIVIVFIVILILYIRSAKNYEINYKIFGFNITEKYEKSSNSYYLSTIYNGELYEMELSKDYLYTKKLVNDVLLSENDDLTCLYFFSNKIDTYPICKKDKDDISYSLVENQVIDSFEYKKVKYNQEELANIKINTLLSKNIFLWNHLGFTYIKKNNNKNINFLNDEVYYDTYSFRIEKYIVIPNLNDKYTFNSIYLIDLSTGEKSLWKTDYDISFNYYFLGEYNNKGYIIDRKNEKEYELNPKNKTIKLISKDGMGKIWNDTWEEVSTKKLSNEKYKFYDTAVFNYYLKDNKLYYTFLHGKSSVLVSNLEISRIISFDDKNGVYYLSKNKLYFFSPFYGEILMIEYNELEFNNQLSVYIY